MKLYLDACCLSRLTGDQSHARVRGEAHAVESILRLIRNQRAVWVSSTVLEVEISRNPDAERRRDLSALLAFANETVVPRAAAAGRAMSLEQLGFDAFDALHLAVAELAGVDVFLTTDDDLVRRGNLYSKLLRTRIANPLSWYQDIAL